MLISKYQADPEGFKKYLPELAPSLESMTPPLRKFRDPFGLTNHERNSREQALREILYGLRTHNLDKEKAIAGLEHFAVLVQDDSLPEEVSYDALASLLKAALGRSVSSIKSSATFSVGTAATDREDAPVEVSIIYGVNLHLNHNMRLAAISVKPHKVRERNKRLSILGLASDVNSDVARNHDEYLVDVSPHASS